MSTVPAPRQPPAMSCVQPYHVMQAALALAVTFGWRVCSQLDFGDVTEEETIVTTSNTALAFMVAVASYDKNAKENECALYISHSVSSRVHWFS